MNALAAAHQVINQASQQPVPQAASPTPNFSASPVAGASAQLKQPSLPVPPPHVAMQFAQLAQNMNPHVLGTLLWRALAQHGAQINQPNPNGVGENTGFFGGGNNVGVYTAPGMASVGGKMGPLGGTIGMDNGKPFGSANINGRQIGSFGPQGK